VFSCNRGKSPSAVTGACASVFHGRKTTSSPPRRPAQSRRHGGRGGRRSINPGGIPSKWKRDYQRLVRARAALLNRQTGLVSDANQEVPAFSLHMADAGTDSFNRDFVLSRISSEQDAVYEIDEAINRIRNGTYGICELTGKPIERVRLEAIPWTRFSAAAEKDLEKSGVVHRTRFAPREPVSHRSEPEPPAATEPEEE